MPLALAVIPARLSGDLVEVLAAAAQCTVLQHGIEHRNHAPRGRTKLRAGCASAVGRRRRGARPRTGAAAAAFGDRVPAGARAALEPDRARARGDARGRSAIAGCRRSRLAASALAAPGVVQCNTHVDPIAWRRGRVFVGADEAAAGLAAHLALRRQRRVDPAEPTGPAYASPRLRRCGLAIRRERPGPHARRILPRRWIRAGSCVAIPRPGRLLPPDQHEPTIALVRLRAREQLFAQRRLCAERVEIGNAVHMVGDRIVVVRLQDQQLPAGYARVPLREPDDVLAGRIDQQRRAACRDGAGE